MTIDDKDMINSILESVSRIDYIKPEDIPNIDLYMDQVTTFMEEQLVSSKRYADDKILTKTMINNYAKNKLLPPPEKKRYSKEHVLMLIFIYYFKNILSINDIQTLLTPIAQKYFKSMTEKDMTYIYNEVFSMEKEQIESYIRVSKTKLEETANQFIKEQGFSCTADIRLEQAYFPTRIYGKLTFPCGVYDAVRVVLGSGNGHNWWCVLYPSLCFTSESFAVMPPESEAELSGLLDESVLEELHEERTLVFGESLGTPLAEPQVKIKPDFYFLRWIRE